MSEPQLRLHSLDALRGIALVAMLLYHFTWDLSEYFALAPGLQYTWPMTLISRSIGLAFTGIAGFSLHLSRQPWRHSVVVLFWALAISALTALFTPEQTVRFGVLHLIGLSLLIVTAARPLLLRLPRRPALALVALLFCLTAPVANQSLLAHLGLSLSHLPLAWLIGFPAPDFASADYYPLLPWFFSLLFGFLLGRPDPARVLPPALARVPWPPLLCRIGRHTLPIYLLHQPILIALLSLFFLTFTP